MNSSTRHDDPAAHIRVDRADVVERACLIEAMSEHVIRLERLRAQVQSRTVDGMRDIVAVHPAYGRTPRNREGGRRKGEVVDRNHGIGREYATTSGSERDEDGACCASS